VSIFDQYAALLRAESPVALATVIEGPNVGAKLLVQPQGEPVG
jgi:xanthine dehydrogenase accessory factor